MEWYVGYTTPDGTTIAPADLRPFYFRVKASDTDTTTKSVIVWVDIGSAGAGSFAVMGSQKSGTELFVVLPTAIHSHLPVMCEYNGVGLQVAPSSGFAEIDIVAAGRGSGGGSPVLAFKVASTYTWAVTGAAAEWYIEDKANSSRKHVSLTPGVSDTTAVTTLNSNLAVAGKFGANGATPVAKAADPGTASGTDAAVVNAVVTALRNVGIVT